MTKQLSFFYRKNYDPFFLLVGHACCDANQGALPAILAFLYAHGSITSFESIAWFIFASNLVSSIVQPLVGYLSDRKPSPWMMTFGILLSSLSISAMGFLTDHHNALLICALLSGIGIAVFHPAAGKTAHAVSPANGLGKGLGLFYVGGNLGFAIGPVLATIGMTMFGNHGTAFMIIPAAIILLSYPPMNAKFQHALKKEKRELEYLKNQGQQQKDRYGAFGILSVAVFLRASLFFSLNAFIPLYWLKILDEPVQTGNAILSCIAITGAIATLCGGFIADKIGVNKVFSFVLTLACPLLICFSMVQNVIVNTILIIPIAFCIYSSSAPMMALGQKFLCNHTGFATGITVGLGVSMGGVVAPLLGWVGDTYGLTATFKTLAVCSTILMIISYLIPSAEPQKSQQSASSDSR
ncbi:MAG: MFS transporter [Succinivibrionaceae bacterium]